MVGQAEARSAPEREIDVSSEASLLVQGGSRHGEVIAIYGRGLTC